MSGAPWFDDFKVIPQSIHEEFASAVKENGKCVEMNMSFFTVPIYTDAFKHQYAEYMRSLFEMGVGITAGTDVHEVYDPQQECCAQYLEPVGFRAEDFTAPKFRVYDSV